MLTVFFTLIFLLAVIAVLLWVKTPYYRLRKGNVRCLLQMVLAGTASENDWAVFTSVPQR